MCALSVYDNALLGRQKKKQIVVRFWIQQQQKRSHALVLFFGERFLATCVGSQEEEKCALRFCECVFITRSDVVTFDEKSHRGV